MTQEPFQPELELEFAPIPCYTIMLSKGAIGDMETLRSHTATDVDSAINLIESLRDACVNRDNVTWQFEEVNEDGRLYGLAPGGTVFEIAVVPPLQVSLS